MESDIIVDPLIQIDDAARGAQPFSKYGRIGLRSAMQEAEYQYYQHIAAELDKVLSLPPDCGIVLIGSIAEGLGNPCSDIDLFYIHPDLHNAGNQRKIVLICGRRIEVFLRSASNLRSLSDVVNNAPRSDAFDAESLHLYQQLSNPTVLRDCEHVRDALIGFSPVTASYFCAQLNERLARSMLGKSALLWRLGQFRRAEIYARNGLLHAERSWLAENGEPYMRPKFHELQLARAGKDRGYSGGIYHFEDSEKKDALIGFCHHSASLLGVDIPLDNRQVSWKTKVDMATLAIKGRLFIDMGSFVLGVNEEASLLLRTNTGVVGDERDDDTIKILMSLHDAGLLSFSVEGNPQEWWAEGAPACPITRPPYVSPDGTWGQCANSPVVRIPMSIKEFATAGAEVTWQHVEIDNKFEDITGAMDVEHWSVVGFSLREAGLTLSRLMLASVGQLPYPEPQQLLSHLHRTDWLPEEILKSIERLVFWDAHNLQTSVDGLELLRDLLRRVPSVLRASYMRGSHNNQKVYDAGHELGMSWFLAVDRLGGVSSVPDADAWIDSSKC